LWEARDNLEMKLLSETAGSWYQWRVYYEIRALC
jgi:hypothetical protein